MVTHLQFRDQVIPTTISGWLLLLKKSWFSADLVHFTRECFVTPWRHFKNLLIHNYFLKSQMWHIFWSQCNITENVWLYKFILLISGATETQKRRKSSGRNSKNSRNVTSSRGVIPRAKIKSVKMTFVIVSGNVMLCLFLY